MRAIAMTQGKTFRKSPSCVLRTRRLAYGSFKIARELNGAGVRDSAVDAAGYLGIYASMRAY